MAFWHWRVSTWLAAMRLHQWLPRPGQGRFIISSEGWLYFRYDKSALTRQRQAVIAFVEGRLTSKLGYLARSCESRHICYFRLFDHASHSRFCFSAGRAHVPISRWHFGAVRLVPWRRCHWGSHRCSLSMDANNTTQNRTLAQMNSEAIRASHILALIDPGAEQQEYVCLVYTVSNRPCLC